MHSGQFQKSPQSFKVLTVFKLKSKVSSVTWGKILIVNPCKVEKDKLHSSNAQWYRIYITILKEKSEDYEEIQDQNQNEIQQTRLQIL